MSQDERTAREIIGEAVSENGAVVVHCDEWPQYAGILTDELFRWEDAAPVAFPRYTNDESGPGPLERVEYEDMSMSTFEEGTKIAKFAKRVSRTVRDYYRAKDRALDKVDGAIGSLENRRQKIEQDWMESSRFFEGDIKKMLDDEADAQAATEKLLEILYLTTVAITRIVWKDESDE